MRGFLKARDALRLGLFSFVSLTVGCASHDPHDIAARADAASGSGLYTWLADHDPSAVVVVGPDVATVTAVARDARVFLSRDVRAGCAQARTKHALLAVLAERASSARDAANDCGFAVFHDDAALVIAPV